MQLRMSQERNIGRVCVRIAFTVLFVLFSTSVVLADTALHMRLLAPDVGWVLRGDALYWTNDGGRQWTDITPPTPTPMEIAGVYFRNTSEGWVLLGRYDEAADTRDFVLASTRSSGASWSLTPVEVPEGISRTGLRASAQIFFLDSTHGWLNVGREGSANFRPALMLATTDGGGTWRALPGDPQNNGLSVLPQRE